MERHEEEFLQLNGVSYLQNQKNYIRALVASNENICIEHDHFRNADRQKDCFLIIALTDTSIKPTRSLLNSYSTTMVCGSYLSSWKSG